MTEYIYVSLQDDDKIVSMSLDQNTGELSRLSEVSAVGGPSALTASPNGDVIYASLRNTNEIAIYKVDSTTGNLSVTGKLSVGESPTYLCIDRRGKY